MNWSQLPKYTVGVRDGLRAAENELTTLLEEYEMLQRQYEKTMLLIEELALQVPGLSTMLQIKGIGLVTAAGFVAFVAEVATLADSKIPGRLKYRKKRR
jgi:hypothetical protein